VVSLTECIIFLLGILAVYRQQTQELIATGLNVNEFDPSNGIEVVVVFLCAITFVSLAFGGVWDFAMIYYGNKDKQFRKSKGVGEPKILNMTAQGGLLLDWLKNADEAAVDRFHTVQLMLNKARARIDQEESVEEKLSAYGAQLEGMPDLMDRVLKSREGEIFLSRFVNDVVLTQALAGYNSLHASALMNDGVGSSVLMWLNEIADPKEKAVFANFIDEVRKFSEKHKRTPSLGDQLTSCWEKTFAAAESVKELEHKVQKAAQVARAASLKSVEIITGKAETTETTKEGTRSLSALIRRNSDTLIRDKDLLLRRNAVERLMKDLLDEANCEGVMLIPIEKVSNGEEFPRMVFASDVYGDDPEKDSARIEEVSGWDCKEGTPSGLCKSSRAVVNVKNLIGDSRFPDLNFKKLGTKAICQISQLVIPVFEGGGATNDAEDDSVGSTLVAVIKLVNKVSFNGEKSGLPFQKKDEILGRVYSALLVEAITAAATGSKAGDMFMSKLQIAMNNQKARKLLSNVEQENKAATALQSTFRAHKVRAGTPNDLETENLKI
jgi:hypothetical protein